MHLMWTHTYLEEEWVKDEDIGQVSSFLETEKKYFAWRQSRNLLRLFIMLLFGSTFSD